MANEKWLIDANEAKKKLRSVHDWFGGPPQTEQDKLAQAVVKMCIEEIDKLEPVQKWIPVTERLPDLIPCGAGTAYSEAVNVLTTGRKVLTAIWDGTDFIADAEFWEAENEEITHWTPVLLPLPESPKGE